MKSQQHFFPMASKSCLALLLTAWFPVALVAALLFVPDTPVAGAELSFPPRLPEGKSVATDTSDAFFDPARGESDRTIGRDFVHRQPLDKKQLKNESIPSAGGASG